ncbi:MAG: TlpA disulfide reductase family protein [Solirubrobacterales bacterium]
MDTAARTQTLGIAMRRLFCGGLLVLLCVALAGCGEDTKPASAFKTIEQTKPDLTGADPRLATIFRQAGDLLGGGRDAYDARIESLDGIPIVVNKWGSWCGPCRREFPLFQRMAKQFGGEVAFLGVNLMDSRDAADEFLTEMPVPYPSYIDDKLEISKLLRPVQGAPTTAFYTKEGVLIKVKIGEYPTLDLLRKDIEEQALQR